MERMYGNYLGTFLLQISAGLGFATLLGGKSSGESCEIHLKKYTLQEISHIAPPIKIL